MWMSSQQRNEVLARYIGCGTINKLLTVHVTVFNFRSTEDHTFVACVDVNDFMIFALSSAAVKTEKRCDRNGKEREGVLQVLSGAYIHSLPFVWQFCNLSPGDISMIRGPSRQDREGFDCKVTVHVSFWEMSFQTSITELRKRKNKWKDLKPPQIGIWRMLVQHVRLTHCVNHVRQNQT